MKNKKQLLRAEADKLWRKAVIEKYGELCEVCGKIAVHCHHFYPRGIYSIVRFEISNGVPLCFHCHFSRHHKGDPKINETITSKRGLKWLTELKKQAYKRPPGSYQTLKYYQDKLLELKELD